MRKKNYIIIFLLISIIINIFAGTVLIDAKETRIINGYNPVDIVADNNIFSVPDIIEKDEIENNKYVGRVRERETDLYTFVFANEDGSNTIRVFGNPVKYID